MRPLSLAFYLGVFLLACIFRGQSQNLQKQPHRSQHSVNAHYAFSYAADVGLEDDWKQRLAGLGYQFTTKRNWYVGVDFQYDRNKRPNYNLNPLSSDGFYTYLSNQIPGGIGYFTKLDYTPPSYVILTSDSIFRTPLDKYPSLSKLNSERYNLFIHFGRRWEKKRNQLEAGLTLHGTFFRSFEAFTGAEFLPIITYNSRTGIGFLYTDGVRYAQRVERSRFVPGAGLHLRYNYQLNHRLGIGLQTMANGSVEGLFVQVTPRLVYSIQNR